MYKKHVPSKGRTLPVALALGLLAGMIVTVLGTSVLAFLIEKETLNMSGVNPGAILIHLLGSAAACFVAYGQIKRQRVVISALSALCYFMIQLGMTALLFGGQYQGIGSCALSIVGGGVLSVLPSIISWGSGGKRIKFKAFR